MEQVAILARVSTLRQDYERQVVELTEVKTFRTGFLDTQSAIG